MREIAEEEEEECKPTHKYHLQAFGSRAGNEKGSTNASVSVAVITTSFSIFPNEKNSEGMGG